MTDDNYVSLETKLFGLGYNDCSQRKQCVNRLSRGPLTTMEPRDVHAVKVGDIKIKTESDSATEPCCITGSALLSVTTLILADHHNNKLKQLDIQTSTVTAELKVSKPWDVASITEDQVAATLRNARKIVFVKVTSVLKLDREISVDGTCNAILHNNGKLIVAFSEPVKIEIMDLNGSVEATIDCSSMFKWPSHMALSPTCDAIYVSDKDGNCVKRLSLDWFSLPICKIGSRNQSRLSPDRVVESLDRVVEAVHSDKDINCVKTLCQDSVVEAVYKDERLEEPRGVIVDQQGRVMVCGGGSDNIHLLTADLTRIKLLMDGLYWPSSLSLCLNTDRLYVARYCDAVSVYQLS